MKGLDPCSNLGPLWPRSRWAAKLHAIPAMQEEAVALIAGLVFAGEVGASATPLVPTAGLRRLCGAFPFTARFRAAGEHSWRCHERPAPPPNRRRSRQAGRPSQARRAVDGWRAQTQQRRRRRPCSNSHGLSAKKICAAPVFPEELRSPHPEAVPVPSESTLESIAVSSLSTRGETRRRFVLLTAG